MSDIIRNLEDLFGTFFHAGNTLIANAMVLGLWLIVDRTFYMASGFMKDMLPPELIALANAEAPLFLKMAIFQKLVILN